MGYLNTSSRSLCDQSCVRSWGFLSMVPASESSPLDNPSSCRVVSISFRLINGSRRKNEEEKGGRRPKQRSKQTKTTQEQARTTNILQMFSLQRCYCIDTSAGHQKKKKRACKNCGWWALLNDCSLAVLWLERDIKPLCNTPFCQSALIRSNVSSPPTRKSLSPRTRL